MVSLKNDLHFRELVLGIWLQIDKTSGKVNLLPAGLFIRLDHSLFSEVKYGICLYFGFDEAKKCKFFFEIF